MQNAAASGSAGGASILYVFASEEGRVEKLGECDAQSFAYSVDRGQRGGPADVERTYRGARHTAQGRQSVDGDAAFGGEFFNSFLHGFGEFHITPILRICLNSRSVRLINSLKNRTFD